MNKNIEFYGAHSSVSVGDYMIKDNALVISNLDILHLIFRDDSQTYRSTDFLFEGIDTLIINGHIFERVKKDV
ncbi:MAG: hypothetical protein J6R47_04245 [Acholeplasmatales bacterium]|nr:hypothetical protein [Acholeplasmatales bacterium]